MKYLKLLETQSLTNIIRSIKNLLTPDLLKGTWKKNYSKDLNSLTGHCYLSTECLYWYLGGPNSNYIPYVLSNNTWDEKLNKGETHWFLKNKITNEIIDITKEQFGNINIPYDNGKPNWMMNHPKGGSKRCKFILNKLNLFESRPVYLKLLESGINDILKYKKDLYIYIKEFLKKYSLDYEIIQLPFSDKSKIPNIKISTLKLKDNPIIKTTNDDELLWIYIQTPTELFYKNTNKSYKHNNIYFAVKNIGDDYFRIIVYTDFYSTHYSIKVDQLHNVKKILNKLIINLSTFNQNENDHKDL